MKGRDIVMMSLQNWGVALGSNSYNLALEFSKHNRVLYVNRAPDRASKINEFIKKEKKTANCEWITSINPHLFVLNTQSVMESGNFLPSALFNRINYLNGKKLAKEISKAINQLQFKEIILFIDNDFFRGLHLKDFLKPDKFIYYIRDNLRTHSYFNKHGQYCEDSIAAKADLVVANSIFLAKLLKPLNKNSHDIGQGCDFNLFKDEQVVKPSDFPFNQQPNIGYVGNIVSYRLDLKMIEEICIKRKDWNWIFVGPEDQEFQNSMLHNLSNVYFLGTKKETELWKYLQHIDVCINPQLKNGMTDGNYPRKIDEYLNYGKPIVARKTDFMISFSDLVYLYNKIEEFEDAINIAINENNIHKVNNRINFVRSNTWEKCTNKIYSLIQNV
jgi:teichuronic acid biosynthesis glycosyltransferase TuaH